MRMTKGKELGKVFITIEFDSDDPLAHIIGLKRLVLDSVSGSMGSEYAGARLAGHDIRVEVHES